MGVNLPQTWIDQQKQTKWSKNDQTLTILEK
jgi:hypothetical protein